jgi:hypothetical protein
MQSIAIIKINITLVPEIRLKLVIFLVIYLLSFIESIVNAVF